jgi:CPA1 family monovalent cation:H+ antiporter
MSELERSAHTDIHQEALHAARQAILAMRKSHEIGDDAFHEIEEELDWLEMTAGSGGSRE